MNKAYISPKTNRFVLDADLIKDYIDNSDKYSNRPYKNNYNSFENVIMGGSGYQYNNNKLVNALIARRRTDGAKDNKKNRIPLFDDLVKDLSITDDNKNRKYRAITINELENNTYSDYCAIFSKNKGDIVNNAKIIFSKKDISERFQKISTRIKDYVKPIKIKNPSDFFSYHAIYPSKKYVIYDPHLFTEEIKETQDKLFFGLIKPFTPINDKNLSLDKGLPSQMIGRSEDEVRHILSISKRLNTPIEEILLSNDINSIHISKDMGRYIKKLFYQLLFYLRWIDNSTQNTKYIPKVYFISQIPIGYSEEWFNFSKEIFKAIVTHPEVKCDELSLLTNQERSLFEKYLSEGMEFLVFDKSSKDHPFRDKILKSYGDDGDHRNIILSDYCDIFWDLRKRYIEGYKFDSFNIGKIKSKQVINIRSIFNEDFEVNKKEFEKDESDVWDQTFEIVNKMIGEGLRLKSSFQERVEESIVWSNKGTLKMNAYINALRIISPSFKEFYDEKKNN